MITQKGTRKKGDAHIYSYTPLDEQMTINVCVPFFPQVGHYAGWPTLSNAVRQFTEILEEQKKMKKLGKKYRSKLL